MDRLERQRWTRRWVCESGSVSVCRGRPPRSFEHGYFPYVQGVDNFLQCSYRMLWLNFLHLLLKHGDGYPRGSVRTRERECVWLLTHLDADAVASGLYPLSCSWLSLSSAYPRGGSNAEFIWYCYSVCTLGISGISDGFLVYSGNIFQLRVTLFSLFCYSLLFFHFFGIQDWSERLQCIFRSLPLAGKQGFLQFSTFGLCLSG